MEICVDFLSALDFDMSLKILLCLEDPSDLVRVGSVSRSWRYLVIANGLCKQLCLKMFPHLRRVDSVIETSSCGASKLPAVASTRFVDWEILCREHRAYAFLAQNFKSSSLGPCISFAISASSTDNFPEESINNTLERGDRVARRPSYWSSKGQSNPMVPETLVYKLVADICVITEISIQPFQAYFQLGSPIYSAKSVRFRMGHPKAPMVHLRGVPLGVSHDQFIWTYTSPEFPMAQENRLQKFVLPEPVLCIGGILQIDLLGRVQRQEMDSLFYICVSHVQVIGRPLSPSFGVEILEPSGKFVLKALSYKQPSLPECESASGSLPSGGYLQEHAVDLRQIMNLLRGLEYNWNDGDEESDEEFLF